MGPGGIRPGAVRPGLCWRAVLRAFPPWRSTLRDELIAKIGCRSITCPGSVGLITCLCGHVALFLEAVVLHINSGMYGQFEDSQVGQMYVMLAMTPVADSPDN